MKSYKKEAQRYLLFASCKFARSVWCTVIAIWIEVGTNKIAPKVFIFWG